MVTALWVTAVRVYGDYRHAPDKRRRNVSCRLHLVPVKDPNVPSETRASLSVHQPFKFKKLFPPKLREQVTQFADARHASSHEQSYSKTRNSNPSRILRHDIIRAGPTKLLGITDHYAQIVWESLNIMASPKMREEADFPFSTTLQESLKITRGGHNTVGTTQQS